MLNRMGITRKSQLQKKGCYDRTTRFSKNHKKQSKPKFVLRVLAGYLKGREPQNRKIEKIQISYFWGGAKANAKNFRAQPVGLGTHYIKNQTNISPSTYS